ncbi:hypothetical protein ABW19_dt0206600 [Dactylella cylindrospora]|nr:hypothetical protein ABW19_dt0206600 [Dactylella cylindrospora]
MLPNFLLSALFLTGYVLASASEQPSRVLQAAKPKLAKRSQEISEYYDFELDFYEGSSSDRVKAMSAVMKISSEEPTFILEDMDHILHEVHCHGERIEITFASPGHCQGFRDRAGRLDTFRLITSHLTCNEDHGRAAYNVTTVTYVEESVVFEVKPLKWADYKSTLNFGPAGHDLVTVSQNRLQRRQEEPETATSTSATPSPTADDDDAESTSKSFSFDEALIDSQIFPPQNSSVIGDFLAIPEGLVFNCKNCTIRGNIDVISGTLDLGNQILDSLDGEWEGSWYEIISNDLFAHIELETLWEGASLFQPYFNVTIIDIPLVGFRIPGVTSVGLFFAALLVFQLTLESDLQLNYGFELEVPNNSTAYVNLGNITDSRIDGFGDTRFDGLPFEAKFENHTVTLSAAFHPRIKAEIDLGSDRIGTGIEAAVYLNLPKYNVVFSPLDGPIDENCIAIEGREPTEVEVLLQDFGNFTHIQPEFEISAGFEFIVDPLVGLEDFFKFEPLAVNFSVPTACVAYVDGTGFVEATAVVASISSELARASESLALAEATKTGDGSPASSTESSGASGLRMHQNPFTRGDIIIFHAMFLALSFIAGCAFLL